jgi:hypothetical protein
MVRMVRVVALKGVRKIDGLLDGAVGKLGCVACLGWEYLRQGVVFSLEPGVTTYLEKSLHKNLSHPQEARTLTAVLREEGFLEPSRLVDQPGQTPRQDPITRTGIPLGRAEDRPYSSFGGTKSAIQS